MIEVQVYQNVDNKQWYWRAVSPNREILANSTEGYVDRNKCLHGVCVFMHIDEDTVPKTARGGFKFLVEE